MQCREIILPKEVREVSLIREDFNLVNMSLPNEVMLFSKMHEKSLKHKSALIIFFPFPMENIKRCLLLGDYESFEDHVEIFFITHMFKTSRPKTCNGLFGMTKWDGDEAKLKQANDWISVEINENVVTVKKFMIQGECKNPSQYHCLWINYDFNVFSQCEILSTKTFTSYSDKSYFKFLREKINEKISDEERKKTSCFSRVKNIFLNLLNSIFQKSSNYNLGQLPVTKYFNVALHIDNYFNGIAWAVKSAKDKKKLDIKVMNLLLSIFMDMLLGILFLNWLNTKISLDSSPVLFLYTAESVVNSIRDLINWLRGDPAGLKLNGAFNNVLSTFFTFHINIWWTFIVFLKPLVKIIFQLFLKLGLLGVTFQASITADLLALVSFHVYCIYAYAAKLYSIQISSLMSLWRLFLGRKKNPLRGKVDSCIYSPEQLFVGTLGFTILLFLLPTTLLYYIVFTCIRLSILMIQAILNLIRHFNQALPVYSTMLWLVRSPKVSAGIEIIPHSKSLKSNFIIMTVKPMTYSWWETLCYFMPDCVVMPAGFNLSDFLTSLISGKLIFPI